MDSKTRYKKLEKNRICVLQIEGDNNEARSMVFDHEYAKFRTSKAKVLRIYSVDDPSIEYTEGTSTWKKKLTYRVGETIEETSFDTNPEHVCAGGIHYFITEAGARAFQVNPWVPIHNYDDNGRIASQIDYISSSDKSLQHYYDIMKELGLDVEPGEEQLLTRIYPADCVRICDKESVLFLVHDREKDIYYTYYDKLGNIIAQVKYERPDFYCVSAKHTSTAHLKPQVKILFMGRLTIPMTNIRKTISYNLSKIDMEGSDEPGGNNGPVPQRRREETTNGKRIIEIKSYHGKELVFEYLLDLSLGPDTYVTRRYSYGVCVMKIIEDKTNDVKTTYDGEDTIVKREARNTDASANIGTIGMDTIITHY